MVPSRSTLESCFSQCIAESSTINFLLGQDTKVWGQVTAGGGRMDKGYQEFGKAPNPEMSIHTAKAVLSASSTPQQYTQSAQIYKTLHGACTQQFSLWRFMSAHRFILKTQYSQGQHGNIGYRTREQSQEHRSQNKE